jgi:hypothetical protein
MLTSPVVLTTMAVLRQPEMVRPCKETFPAVIEMALSSSLGLHSIITAPWPWRLHGLSIERVWAIVYVPSKNKKEGEVSLSKISGRRVKFEEDRV